MNRKQKFVVTCEHASCTLPQEYINRFRVAGDFLRSHNGYDIGAADVAERLSAFLDAPLVTGTFSRLLIDLNRSAKNPHLFSKFSSQLTAQEKKWLIDSVYTPYREKVQAAISKIEKGDQRTIHISVHSFTPILRNRERQADIGLLYDPRRPFEKRLCDIWTGVLKTSIPNYRVRRNYPYKGISDGLTSHLRRRYLNKWYAGIEIEINQSLFIGRDRVTPATLAAQLHQSLLESVKLIRK